jgi:hypothetical protein
MSEVIHGACLCGQVGFDVEEPKDMGVCYCTRCTRWTGASGNTVLVVGSNDFHVTKGQDVIKQYKEEGFAVRYFCSNCGSGVYTDGGEVYYVPAGVLRDVTLTPAWHIQVANKADWYEIAGDAPQFAEYPAH